MTPENPVFASTPPASNSGHRLRFDTAHVFAVPDEGVRAAELAALQTDPGAPTKPCWPTPAAGFEAEFACLNLPALMPPDARRHRTGGGRHPPLPRRGGRRHRRLEPGRQGGVPRAARGQPAGRAAGAALRREH